MVIYIDNIIFKSVYYIMSKVIKLGITKNSAQKIEEVEKIEILSGKGVVGDRSFQDSKDARKQITLIESENIDYYN